MATDTTLMVFAHLGQDWAPCGQLQMTEEGPSVLASTFAYGLNYARRPDALEVDPVSLSLQDRAQVLGKRLLPANALPLFGGSQTSVTLNTPAGTLTFAKGNWPGGSSAVLIDLEEVDEFIEHVSTFFTDTPEPLIRQLHAAVALIRREDAKKEAIDRPFNPLAVYNTNSRPASANPKAMTKASPFVLFDRPTTLKPELLNAYLETDYKVVAPESTIHERTFTMRVGHACEPLAQLFQDRGIQCATFVTAYNPYSAAHEHQDNETRQASLLQTLDEHKVVYLSGEGRHPSGNWPAEPSVLALNLPLDASKRLGMRFHQNAVLWCDARAIPHLVLPM